jgi:hypothetical protein
LHCAWASARIAAVWASGIIGTTFLAKSLPDGYTIMLGSGTTHATNVAAHAKEATSRIARFNSREA